MFVASLAAVTLLCAACASNSNDAAAKDGKAKDAEQPAKTDAEQPIAGTPVEGEQKVATAPAEGGSGEPYALQIEPGAAKVGEAATVAIRVVPNADWHMNLDYPTKLTVEPPAGVDVPKPKLAKDDAVKLDDHGCEFAVGFTPSEAGEKTFTGEFKFAVCQDTACVPKTEKLEFKVAVQ